MTKIRSRRSMRKMTDQGGRGADEYDGDRNRNLDLIIMACPLKAGIV
jgi:hypothetical protein